MVFRKFSFIMRRLIIINQKTKNPYPKTTFYDNFPFELALAKEYIPAMIPGIKTN